MNKHVKEMVEDRIECIEESLTDDEREDYGDEECLGLKSELADDKIGPNIERCVVEYCERDNWLEYCNRINRALAEAGRLEMVPAVVYYFGSRPKVTVYKGIQYYAKA